MPSRRRRTVLAALVLSDQSLQPEKIQETGSVS